jgi:dihydroflavonol-4-reductase
MNIAITGASGHIGANLCRALVAEGHKLTVLINRSALGLEDLNLERIKGNLLTLDALKDLTREADVVIHLAAAISIRGRRDRNLLDINVIGTENLLTVVKRNPLQRFIHFSSIHALVHEPYDQVLDEQRGLVTDDPILYNRSKAISEQLVLKACQEGMDALVINPTSVIGPDDFRPSLLGQAVRMIYNNKLPALIPGGYDWVDVRDVVKGTVSALEKGRKGERYLLSGHYRELKDLAGAINHIKGQETVPVMLPSWLALLGVPLLQAHAALRKTEPLYTRESVLILRKAHKHISCEKAGRELDYHPRSFEETIRDTVGWFREHQMVHRS